MKTGLFFGSFNPVHIGHLAIANYMVEFTDLNEFWFVVSPHNPLKEKKSLLKSHHRFDMVYKAIENDIRFQVTDIEFRLPQPSYTINTLAYLRERYPKYEFSLIMGMDNLENIQKWKNYEEIINNYRILVYPRPKSKKNEWSNKKNINLVEAPIMEISSSFIRKAIKEKKDIRYFLPSRVYEYIQQMHFYE
ncbi:MAG: nicotinate-nucleotide adenylyltransferase [Chlorobi bacterium]|nr:nicotinate-nucleotide adenylyltransferase [Chlorobiota bacterium]